MFTDAVADIAAIITALGVTVVTDPRNARPMTVYLEPPTFVGYTNQVVDATIIARVLGPPPGNQDSLNYILGVVDTLHDSTLAITSGAPSTAVIGEQALPTYDLTLRLAVERI